MLGPMVVYLLFAMKFLFFALSLSLVTLTSPISADGIDSWYLSNHCDRTDYRANLSQQYQICMSKVNGCSEECIKSYAKGMSSTDCASPSDMQDVVDACNKSCPSSPLCSLPKLQCAYPIAGHSCENYKTCVNDIKDCDTDGYALGFGYKYCTAYLNHNDKFSSKGKIWAKNVRICLQQAFIDKNVESMTCDEISNYAVGTHFNCYSNLGYPTYCDLTFWDRIVVSATASSALLSSRFLSIAKQAFQVNAACLVPGFFSVDGQAQPDMLTVRITFNIPRQTLATTYADDTMLQSTIQSFITRMESSIITTYPSLPANATLLFGNLYGTNTNTTLDVLINLNRASNITVDIYAIASYLQTQLISGGIPSPYTVIDVQSAQPTNTQTGKNPSTSEQRNNAHVTAPTIIVLALVAVFYQLFQ